MATSNSLVRNILVLLTCLFILGSLTAQIKLNEVYIPHDSLSSNTERFIELKNVSDSTVSLKGFKFCLSKNQSSDVNCSIITFSYESETLLKSDEITFVKVNRTPLNDYFLYSQLILDDAKMLFLKGPNGDVVDSVYLFNCIKNQSLSRFENDNWCQTTPTKGKENLEQNSLCFRNDAIIEGVDSTLSQDTVDLLPVYKKIKLNEIFFVHDPNGFINNDFWVEITNTGEHPVDISQLSLTTDTTKQKVAISTAFSGYLLQPEQYATINISEDKKHWNGVAVLEDHSPCIYLYFVSYLLDSMTVSPMKRSESMSRLPNGVGEPILVGHQTKGKTNKQILPSENTVNSSMFYHSLGLVLNDYNYDVSNFRTKIHPGVELGLGFEFVHLGLFSRLNFNLSRIGVPFEYDTTIIATNGVLKQTTEGVNRMSYFKTRYELGVPLCPKLNFFIGGGINILTDQEIEGNITSVSEFDDGTSSQTSTSLMDPSLFKVEKIDLDASIALEFNFSSRFHLRVAYFQDYFGIREDDLEFNFSNYSKVHQLMVYGIFPLARSTKLKYKTYLFY